MPVIILLAFIIIIVYGWIDNILWILAQSPMIWDGETIISVIGIFIAPLGAIMGLFVH